MSETMDRHPKDTANHIARSAWVIAALSFVALSLNLVWNMILASLFGATGPLDAFWVAVALPKAITDSFHLGLLAILFIGIFGLSESWLDREKRWRLASSVLNVVVVITVAMVAVIFTAAPIVVDAMGPGLSPADGALATQMLRVLSLVLLLTVITGALTGILNAHQKFLPYALVRVVGLTVQVVVLVVAAGQLGIRAAVWAIVGGAAAMLAVAVTAGRRLGIRYAPTIAFHGSEAVSVRHLFATLAALSVLVFVNQASDRFFASLMGAGSISALEFAGRFEIPITQIASFSVALPAFALFALHMSTGQMGKFRETVAISIRLVALLVLPMVAFVVILRAPLTAIWLERGSFGAEETRLVASLIPLYATIFLCRAFAGILVFGLICTRHARLLVITLVAEVLANTAMNATFGERFGIHGIVLATAVAMLASNLVLWTVFVRSMGAFSPAAVFRRATKIVVVNAVAASVLFAFSVAVSWTSSGPARSVSLMGVSGIVFGLAYLATCYGVGLIEFRWRRRFLPGFRLKTREWNSPHAGGIGEPSEG